MPTVVWHPVEVEMVSALFPGELDPTVSIVHIIYSVVWDEGGVGFFCVSGLIYMASSFVADDSLARSSG